MLSVIMMSVVSHSDAFSIVMLSVIVPSVIMRNVAASLAGPIKEAAYDSKTF